MKPIQKAVIFYFSGTGNARQVALWFSEFAHEKGIDCQLMDIAKTNLLNIGSIDSEALIIFISPIHGFNYPKITLSFIRNFRKGENRVVLMNTRAGMKIGNFVTPGLTGIAFFLSSFWLKRKGYKILGTIPFDMPSNWISLHPALSRSSIMFLHRKNYERVTLHAGKIFAGKTDFYSRRDIIQDILIFPISLGYYVIGRFIFAKTFYANDTCDNCGICIQGCPVKAIKTIQNKPFWTLKCESCMKCMNSCPKKSIETAHALIVAVSIIYSIIFTYLTEKILSVFFQSEMLLSVIETIVFLLVMIVVYRIQHLLLRNKIVGRFISLLSVTHYKFWGRYKSIPDNKWK
jgi:Pyruvate/2-oxoacid:ferredoxin oxidoreductase delta subunit